MINTGTLQANGGTLRLTGGSYTNTGGLIQALGSSVVELNGANVVGGTLSTGGTAVIRNTVTSTLDGITLNGTLEQNNATTLNLLGTITNNGNIKMNSLGNQTNLVIGSIAGNETVTIDGTGTITFSNNTNNRIYGAAVTNRLVLESSQSITGAGQIGVNLMALTNLGTIDANVSNSLTIDPSDSGVINKGTLKASSGGTLILKGGTFTNFEGTTNYLIEADDGSEVQLNGATVVGGVLSTSGTGFFRNTVTSTLDSLTLNGTLEQNNATTLNLKGTITNNGNIKLNSLGNQTNLVMDEATVTINGAGAITLSNNTNNRIYGTLVANRLVLESGQTISGAGQIGVNSMALTNLGTINANVSNSLTIDPSDSGVINKGTLKASSGGTLILKGGTFTNFEGTTNYLIEADNGSEVQLNGANVVGGVLSTVGTGFFRNTGTSTLDSLTLNGTLEQNNATTLNLKGTITNNGNIKMNSLGNQTNLVMDEATVTINGAGAITLSNNTNNRIYGTLVANRLVLESGQTISGAGQLGVNSMTLTNNGTIEATQATPLTINLTGITAFTNEGTLRASGTGGLVFTEALTNTDTLEVLTGSKATITGNYVQTLGSTLVDGILDPTGLVDIQGGSLFGSGTIKADVTNAGSIFPGSSPGLLTIDGALTLQSTSLLTFELGGLTQGAQYDSINVLGNLNLNGDIDILFIDGFQNTISGSDNFILMNALTLEGAFSNAPNGTSFETAIGYSFILNYGVGSPFSATQVVLTDFVIPEPSTYALWLGMILFGVVFVRRRKEAL